MNRTIRVVVGIMVILTWAVASEAGPMVNGAGPVDKGQLAFTGELGITFVEPLLYGLRLDYGVAKRFQLGIGGTVWGFMNSATLYSTINLFNHDDRDYLSLHLNTSMLHVQDVFFDDDGATNSSTVMYFINPLVGYEHRMGEEKKSGVYLKVGTLNLLGASHRGDLFDAFHPEKDFVFDIHPGLQFSATDTFGFFVDGQFLFNPSHWSDNSWFAGGKIGLSWGF